MTAARFATLLHHAADLAGQIRQQILFVVLLFIEQPRYVGGAKLVGIAAELRQLGQANFARQDAAMGETWLGREIGRRQRRVEVAKAGQGGQQDGRGGRGIGQAGAGRGRDPGGLEGADGSQPLVVALLAKQRQALFRAVALQIREARLYVGEPDLAVGVLGVRGQEGGQGGAGIPVALQQIDGAGGEVQGALAGGHQQRLLTRFGQAQRRRQARHAAADNDTVEFHDGSP
ncbi:hypothetical protein D3C79_705450 [compost metagenome]